MTISVVIATYGDPEWRETAWNRAVPSVMAQEAYAAKNMIVRHGGETIAESRNGAAGSAQCDWLCFLDADDELAPGFLGAMQRALEQNPSDGKVLLTPAVQQIRKGRPGKPFFFPECTFDTGNWLVIGTLISRDLFHQIGGFREHPHGLEDWNLWARAVRAGARVVKVPDAVYRAHINPKSKHHMLSRRRDEYMIAYHAAQADVL